MINALIEYYRVPEALFGNILGTKPTSPAGFFRFGPETICYGQCGSGSVSDLEKSILFDASKAFRVDESEVHLPFDPDQVIENLRRERYEEDLIPSREGINVQPWALNAYYSVRNFLPVALRRQMQKAYFADWKYRKFPAWPVDTTVDTLHDKLLRISMEVGGLRRVPFIWFWPEGAPSCLILTHDVETKEGRDFTSPLMNLDDAYNFKASFQVVPEQRYEVPDEYVEEIGNRGFEFNIHDLNHDGHLYRNRHEFLGRAKKINEYVRRYNARGFRAGSMHRVLDWYDAFEFSYDMSLSNVAHFDPKRGGCCTVFPFFVGGIVELPLTTTQDYSIFHIMNDYSIDLWKKQANLIRQRNGLMSFLAHPDYLISERSRKVYELLLAYLRKRVAYENVWAPLPGEVDRWWRDRARMKLIEKGNDWAIEGPGKERARLAYAVLDGDRLMYEVPTNFSNAVRS